MNDVICLMGPTASGKTDLACLLTDKFPIELISVDSALIYQQMDIGTAKPSKDTLKQYPHYLIDIIKPIETYSAAAFCHDAIKHIHDIWRRGKIPCLVGGTMMYFQALQQGLANLPDADESIREKLESIRSEQGLSALYEKLQQVDPKSAAKINEHDAQRIQRALEVYELTQKPMSELVLETKPNLKANFHNIALFPKDRAWLHDRIAIRFYAMLEQGFLPEVQALMTRWPDVVLSPSFRSVGYRQAHEYLAGYYDKKTFIAKGIAATRQLAKRQLTWLRHWPTVDYIDPKDTNYVSEVVEKVRKI